MSDANTSGHMEECVIQHEPKKQIRARIGLIVQTYLRNVDCVRDVHRQLMTLVLTATLECLAIEVWCPELRTTVDSKASLNIVSPMAFRFFNPQFIFFSVICVASFRTCIRI